MAMDHFIRTEQPYFIQHYIHSLTLSWNYPIFIIYTQTHQNTSIASSRKKFSLLGSINFTLFSVLYYFCFFLFFSFLPHTFFLWWIELIEILYHYSYILWSEPSDAHIPVFNDDDDDDEPNRLLVVEAFFQELNKRTTLLVNVLFHCFGFVNISLFFSCLFFFVVETSWQWPYIHFLFIWCLVSGCVG